MAFHVELEFASRTDTGLVRAHNEDAIAISAECGLAILADGMGGYNAGEVASGIATSVLKETLEEQLLVKGWDSGFHRTRRLHHILSNAIAHTNKSIIEAARLEPTYVGMGTTLVAALFHYDKVTIAHIGDSRAYCFRQNELTQLTRDHSLLQEQIDAGILTEDEAQFSGNRNLITRAMGVDYDVEVELHDYATQPDDIYILCSDGLSDMLTDKEIGQVLHQHSASLAQTCDTLVYKANISGGRDNISVVLAKTKSQQANVPGMAERFIQWMRR